MNDLLEIAIEASLIAGMEINKVYRSDDFKVEWKGDDSPLTRADKNANNVIVKNLEKTGIPILSEEGRDILFKNRKDWKKFWLVDPLDGTKEFIKRNGEFTVNIALIEDETPVLGVIFVPVTNELYFANNKIGSRKTQLVQSTNIQEIIEESESIPYDFTGRIFTAVVSRSHMSKETEEFLNSKRSTLNFQKIEFLSRGSSLKICMVAEGKADVYPRFGPTMEWDTAAGHAIAKFAGKKVYRVDNGEELTYNKENLLNPYFIVE